MAEAVAVFATAGGALQVADVALRWGGKIYEFLSAVRQAPQEVQSLRKAVDDVNSVIRDLNRYIAEFNMSASARAEHNVLPEVVIRAVQGFRDDLASIKELLPIESPLRLGQKIRWGLDKKRKLKEATEKLESRKTTVLLALEIDGRWADIKKRDNIRNLGEALTATSRAAIDNHASSLETVTSELAMIRGSGQRSEVLQAQSHTLLQGISDSLTPAHGAFHDKLDYITSIVTSLKLSSEQSFSTTSTYTIGSEESLRKVVRAELRNVLPALEQGLAKSLSGKDAILRHIERDIDLVSGQMSEAATSEKFAASDEEQTRPPSVSQARTGPMDASMSSHHSSRSSTSGYDTAHETDLGRFQPLSQTPRSRTPVRLLDRIWSINCRIGYLKIRFQRFRRRDEFLGHDPFFRISVMFYPSSRLMALPGLSTYFTNTPDQQGHYQLCPSLSTFPIVPRDAPVWEYISRNDVEGLRSLFVAGLASPRDQRSDGQSLLSKAAYFGFRDMCKFLLEAGADPTISHDILRNAFLGVDSTDRIPLTLHDSDVVVDTSIFEQYVSERAEIIDILWNASGHLLDGDAALLSSLGILITTIPGTPEYEWLALISSLTFELRQIFLADLLNRWFPGLIFFPCRRSSIFLKILLSCGFDPNTNLGGVFPLNHALLALSWAKPCGKGLWWVMKDTTMVDEWLSPLNNIVTLLLLNRADPYITTRVEESDLTLTDLAISLELQEEWENALSESGYDPKEVCSESARRLAEREIYQRAERSAVDMTEILPQRERLTRRSGHVFEEE